MWSGTRNHLCGFVKANRASPIQPNKHAIARSLGIVRFIACKKIKTRCGETSPPGRFSVCILLNGETHNENSDYRSDAGCWWHSIRL